jgi:PAS domain S-box-containing protein
MALADAAAPPENSEFLLAATLEELQVAEEELRAQHEELMAARAAVEAQRERYQHLFEFAPVGYVVTSANGTIRQANRAAARLLGKMPEVLVGKPLATFVVTEERGAFRTAFARLLSASEVEEWPIRLQPHRRRAVDVTMTVEAVRDESGAISSMYWIIRDDSGRLEGDLL